LDSWIHHHNHGSNLNIEGACCPSCSASSSDSGPTRGARGGLAEGNGLGERVRNHPDLPSLWLRVLANKSCHMPPALICASTPWRRHLLLIGAGSLWSCSPPPDF
jgi:hypothetical protein